MGLWMVAADAAAAIMTGYSSAQAQQNYQRQQRRTLDSSSLYLSARRPTSVVQTGLPGRKNNFQKSVRSAGQGAQHIC